MSALQKHEMPNTEVMDRSQHVAYADPFLAMIERAADRLKWRRQVGAARSELTKEAA